MVIYGEIAGSADNGNAAVLTSGEISGSVMSGSRVTADVDGIRGASGVTACVVDAATRGGR